MKWRGVLILAVILWASASSAQALPTWEVRAASKIIIRTKLAPLLTTKAKGTAPFRVNRCDGAKCHFAVNGTIQCVGVIHVALENENTFRIWISRMRCR